MSLLDSARQWLGRRAPTQAKRRFEGARADRLTSDWQATVASINEELRADLDRLRSRCRNLVNHKDYARKFRSMVQTNLVGPGGVRLQARVQDGPGRPDRLANAAIEAAWAEWSGACDLAGRPLRDLCETLVGQLPADGEFIVRMVRGPAAGNRFGFALQAIDADRIDTTYNQAGVGGRNAVIMGVEVDTYRRPVALWVFSAHPNDGIHAARQRERVPMSDVVHAFKLERPEQLRGIPWMAPGVISLYHLGKFSLAALLAAEHGANHYGFFQTPDGISPVGVDEGGEQISVSQPGTYDVLPAGVTFQQHESKYPDQAFAPFVKAQLQRIASGWGVAYHSLANDLEGVNFSSARSGTLEERDRWASDQQWLIAALLRPVYLQWLQQALLRGAIVMPNGSALPSSKLAKFSRHEWQPRRWEWVDPVRDMEAKIMAVKAGLMSPQDLCAAIGNDFEDTLKSIAAAQKMAAEFGVPLAAYQQTPPVLNPPAGGTAPNSTQPGA
jgi:lambda family phage portal protein